MTANTQFSSIQELETAFRAIVLFKFGGSGDSDVFLGSPVMASAANSMLDSIEQYWISAGNSKRAEQWRGLYLMSKAARHVDLISSHAARHPEWAIMSREERLAWLQVVAAPYRIDDAGVVLFDALLAE
jgi:hypothetical protein